MVLSLEKDDTHAMLAKQFYEEAMSFVGTDGKVGTDCQAAPPGRRGPQPPHGFGHTHTHKHTTHGAPQFSPRCSISTAALSVAVVSLCRSLRQIEYKRFARHLLSAKCIPDALVQAV